MTSRWMKAIIFWVFYHFANSPTNYRFFDTYLIVSYQKGEENCLLDVYILTRELYVFTRKRSVFWHVLASCSRNVYCLNLVFDPHWKKRYLRLYLTQIIQLNCKMLFAWWKNCLSKFLWCACHVYQHLVIFCFKEKFCVSHASASLLRDV